MISQLPSKGSTTLSISAYSYPSTHPVFHLMTSIALKLVLECLHNCTRAHLLLAYGAGFTDWFHAYAHLLHHHCMAGVYHGGVSAGLAACDVMISIVSTVSDHMQNFKTGYLTLASPRSMFISQVDGNAMAYHCTLLAILQGLWGHQDHDFTILGVDGFSLKFGKV